MNVVGDNVNWYAVAIFDVQVMLSGDLEDELVDVGVCRKKPVGLVLEELCRLDGDGAQWRSHVRCLIS